METVYRQLGTPSGAGSCSKYGPGPDASKRIGHNLEARTIVIINYVEAKNLIFARGVIPNGYNGDTAEVNFAFDPVSGKTLVLEDGNATTPTVYFPYHTPPATDVREAMWLLRNHPSSNVIRFIPTYEWDIN